MPAESSVSTSAPRLQRGHRPERPLPPHHTLPLCKDRDQLAPVHAQLPGAGQRTRLPRTPPPLCLVLRPPGKLSDGLCEADLSGHSPRGEEQQEMGSGAGTREEEARQECGVKQSCTECDPGPMPCRALGTPQSCGIDTSMLPVLGEPKFPGISCSG